MDNRAILCKVRGISAAGSAFASHVKGRGFESHMLHGKGLSFSDLFSFCTKVVYLLNKKECHTNWCGTPFYYLILSRKASAP